ncbi:AAA family ATPase [Aurantimonas sp. C2-4-R8]|nr:AAA family ATPase [Aurantimonas sp. C2-4-R8]
MRRNYEHRLSGVSKRPLRDVSPLQISNEEIRELASWPTFSALEPNIAGVFAVYRDVRFANDMKRLTDEREGTKKHLDNIEFLESYGPPPWEKISTLLKNFGLNYNVVSPSHEISEACSFVLQRLDNGARVSIEALSLVEKVLLRFALSLLQFDPRRITVTEPKLLLLDEMDASLHPEMVHRWLTAIQEGLVVERGMFCILTTHSPTTVALAPEDALFEMADSASSPRKVTKQQALNRLTFGVPTLSIDYSGRRQVLVESDTDAASYEQLAAVMKARLNLPRTLTFMSTGVRNGKDETNTGCRSVSTNVRQPER